MATKSNTATRTSRMKKATGPRKKSAAGKKMSGRKYSGSASKKVETAMRKRKKGTLRSGSGKKVTNRKQAIAIGLSEARASGKKVPAKATSRKKPR